MASRSHVKRAIELYQEQLEGYPNVTGIGVVPVDDDPGGPAELAVAVYVTRKVPRNELADDEMIPIDARDPRPGWVAKRPHPHHRHRGFRARGGFDIEPA